MFVVNDSLLFWSVPDTPVAFVGVGVGLVGLATALVNYLSGPLRLPSRGGLVIAAFAAVFAPLLPMTAGVQAGATVAVLALLVLEAKYDPGRGTERLDRASS